MVITERYGTQYVDFVTSHEEFNKAFDSGMWVNAGDVCAHFGISFAEALKRFKFARIAEWSKTGNGQDVHCYFKKEK